MPSKKSKLSLIIPAYNEEQRIENVLKSYEGVSQELIAVANGCTDITAEIVEKFSTKYPHVKLLNFRERLGKGGAIIQGFKKASYDVVGFVDSDLSVPPKEVKRLCTVLKEEDLDGVIGSRRVTGSKVDFSQPLKRRLPSRSFNLLIRALFGLKFRDTQCGAKFFSKEVIDAVVEDLVSTGYEFDVELLWRLNRRGYRVKEVGIEWSHSPKSKFSLHYAPRMLKNLLNIRFLSPKQEEPKEKG